MLCILAVFLPALFLEGAAQGLFYPLALAVRVGDDRLVHFVEYTVCPWLAFGC